LLLSPTLLQNAAKRGVVWRPRFLISVINANSRFSRVKPAYAGRT
jgi:hypothetical protein